MKGKLGVLSGALNPNTQTDGEAEVGKVRREEPIAMVTQRCRIDIPKPQETSLGGSWPQTDTLTFDLQLEEHSSPQNVCEPWYIYDILISKCDL